MLTVLATVESSTLDLRTSISLASVVVAVVGVSVPVGLFVMESRRRRRSDLVEQRRTAIIHVLDAVDRIARGQALFPLSQIWMRPEAELSLTLSRLLLELPKAERDVAMWVARQTQLIQLESRQSARLALAVEVSFKLAAWHQGDLQLKWFSDQLASDPFNETLRIPLHIKIKKFLAELWAWTRIQALFLGAVLTLRKLLAR